MKKCNGAKCMRKRRVKGVKGLKQKPKPNPISLPVFPPISSLLPVEQQPRCTAHPNGVTCWTEGYLCCSNEGRRSRKRERKLKILPTFFSDANLLAVWQSTGRFCYFSHLKPVSSSAATALPFAPGQLGGFRHRCSSQGIDVLCPAQQSKPNLFILLMTSS